MQCRFKELGVKSCMQLCDCSFRAPLSTRHQKDTQVDSTGQDQSTLSSTSTQRSPKSYFQTNNGCDTNANRRADSNSSQSWERIFACNRAIENVSTNQKETRVESTQSEKTKPCSAQNQLSTYIPPDCLVWCSRTCVTKHNLSNIVTNFKMNGSIAVLVLRIRH